MLKVIYTLFMGLLLATFVGVGIAAFRPAPVYPTCGERIVLSVTPTDQKNETPELKQQREDCQAQVDAHEMNQKRYMRNVSITALTCALLFLAIGLLFAKQIALLADGFLLGGLFTLVYSVGTGFATEDNRYRFIVVSVGLLIALLLGYLKFVRPEQTDKRG